MTIAERLSVIIHNGARAFVLLLISGDWVYALNHLQNVQELVCALYPHGEQDEAL